MANYVTSDFVVRTVFGLLSSITKPKYETTAPDFTAQKLATPGEYIVINALKNPADVMQLCYFNVNYHVKDIKPGMKDHAKLEAGSLAILNLLEKVTATNYLIDFESQETFREEQLGEHFSNLRFSFKNINK